MAKWPVPAYNGVAVLHGGSMFVALGGSYADTTESRCQEEARATYTLSNLRCYCSNITASTNIVIITRKNTADGSQTITVNATGEFEDTTNTDSLVSGDLINIEEGSGGTQMHNDTRTIESYQVTFDASTDEPPLWGGAGGMVSADRYWVIVGGVAGYHSTESWVERTFYESRTLRDLRVYCSSYTSDQAITVRKNRAATSLTVTLTGTGEFLDTSNTATYSSGDECNMHAGSGTCTISLWGVEGSESSHILCGGESAFQTATRWFHPGNNARSTSEAWAEVEAEADATVNDLLVACNGYGATASVRTRKNGANGSCSVSVTGTGVFTDTSNSDSLAAEDDLALQADSSVTGNRYPQISVEWETATAPTDAFEAARQFGTVQPVLQPVEVVAY
jgi:hypothetical protein